MNMLRPFGLILLIAVAACAPRIVPPQPAPLPRPVQPAPTPRPVQPAPAPIPSTAWMDAPLSAGGWTYRGNGSAAFGPAGSPSFVMTCTGSRVRIERSGASGGVLLTVRTSNEARNLPAALQGGALVAELAASDPLLDAIGFSRGRFSVEAPGTLRLIIPAWPEAARVVEDCRR